MSDSRYSGRNERIEFRNRPKKFVLEGSHRVVKPAGTLAKVRKNSIIASVVRGTTLFEDDALGVPVFIMDCSIIPKSHRTDRIMGKGMTRNQALCSGLMEAIERYSCSIFPDEDLIRATYEDLAEQALDPESIGVFRDGAYAPDLAIDWIRAWNITRGQPVLVPVLFGLYVSSFNDHWYTRLNDPSVRYTYSDSNGCAAGNVIEEAVLHGLYEVLERDAITIGARNIMCGPNVEPDGIQNQYLQDVLGRLQQQSHLSFRLKWLTLDLELPVFGCMTFDHAEGQAFVGYGGHLDPEIGMLRAISEMMQARALFEQIDKHRSSRRRYEPDYLSEFEYLWNVNGGSIALGDLEDKSGSDLLDDLHNVLDMLRAKDLDVMVVNRTHRSGGIPVVKVLVPGLQRVDWVWAFGDKLLAQGSDRVLRVPQELGLAASPKTREELDITQITFQ